MARAKAKEDAAAAEAQPTATAEQEGGSAESSGSVSKREMVRQAIDALGRTARPRQIHGYIREHFHLEMGRNHISSYKSQILKEGKPTARAPAAGAPAARVSDGISLKDIRALMELADRIGPAKMRSLVELLFSPRSTPAQGDGEGSEPPG
jgi:hypothetical protein